MSNPDCRCESYFNYQCSHCKRLIEGLTTPSYPSVAEMQARHAGASRDSLATQLEQMRRERDEARSDRDSMAQALGEANVALAEARATNARLHRRAQGVDARSPDDADLIRRLRADVHGQAKHAGYVAGYVMRLRCALSDAQHAWTKAERERDEARERFDDLSTVLEENVRGRTEALAKLARVRELLFTRDYHDNARDVLRIIDEKEGGT